MAHKYASTGLLNNGKQSKQPVPHVNSVKKSVPTPKNSGGTDWIIWAGIIALLLSALPFGLYPVGKFVAFVVFLYYFLVETKSSNNGNLQWILLMLGGAIVFNPVLPIRLGSYEAWAMVDVVGAIILYKYKIKS